MKYSFDTVLFEWRGPAPFYFAAVPEKIGAEIKVVQKELSYGWGVIPCVATIGNTEWKTSLMPKDGHFYLPIKNAIRTKFGFEVDDDFHVSLRLGK